LLRLFQRKSAHVGLGKSHINEMSSGFWEIHFWIAKLSSRRFVPLWCVLLAFCHFLVLRHKAAAREFASKLDAREFSWQTLMSQKLNALKKLDTYLFQTGYLEIEVRKSADSNAKVATLRIQHGDREYVYTSEANEHIEALDQAARKACEYFNIQLQD